MTYELYGEELGNFILNASTDEIQDVLEYVHPEDILDVVRLFEEQKTEILKRLPLKIIPNIIDQAEDEEKYNLLKSFPDDIQNGIINEMASDELADLLGSISPKAATKLLSKVNRDDLEEIKDLLKYDPDTAGGIMATEFIAIRETMSIDETLKYLQKEAPDAETAYYVYVLDDNETLKGIISLRDIVTSNFDVKIYDVMNENVVSVPVDMDQEEVSLVFQKYGFLTIPVVDANEKMLGIVTIDDIISIVQEESTEDIYLLGGLSEGERVEDGLIASVKKRLPWLLVNLGTAILASFIVSLFEDTIAKAVTLAAFMPIVAGMGGNAGTQTLTLIVRGIALGELTFENTKKVLLKEIGVGLLIGITVGCAMGIISYIWRGNIALSVVIGCAMLLNMIVATLFGVIVPVVLKKLNIDPALASGVFVTTATDVLGFFFFLGLATVFIVYLV